MGTSHQHRNASSSSANGVSQYPHHRRSSVIYQKKNGTSVEYYTREQADEKGMTYIPWREARTQDVWILSDDDYVLQVVEVKTIVELQKGGVTPRVRYRIKTGLATRYPHGKMPMEIKRHILTKSYGIYPQHWFEDFDKRYPAIRSMLTKAVISGAIHMSKNRRYTRDEYAEMIRIAKKIFDDKRWSWYNVRTYFGREEVREQIRQDIIKIAKKRGIDVEKVFDLIEEAEGVARTKKDAKVLLAIAKEYGAIIGVTAMTKQTGELPQGEELPGAEDAYDRIIEKGSRDATA
jgi:hypothetical protein